MNSRTISQGFRVPTSAGEEGLHAGLPEEAEDRDEAEPTGLAYLVVFAIVAVVTVLAFIPVWLLVLCQRAVQVVEELVHPRR